MDLTALGTGKLIFESVPSELQPRWAGFVLSQFNYYVRPLPKQVSELFTLIKHPDSWKLAHEQFTEIRKLLLSNSLFELDAYLYLAEIVAKVTYNASGAPAPFDEDSGWYLPQKAIEAANGMQQERLIPDLEAALLLCYNNPLASKDLTAATDYLIYKEIDDILWFEWDPINVNNLAPRDEYLSYLPKIYALKKSNASEEEIAAHLSSIESERMSIESVMSECLRIARLIVQL